MSDTIEELAYREAVRSISEQRSALDNLRARTGILLSASAIATSLLGGLATGSSSLSTSQRIAVALFAVSSLVALWVLSPARGWIFSQDGSVTFGRA